MNPSEFKNPSIEWRGKPFWAWNGKLEKDELLRQIHVMKEMGFGGFFMHSRTGLETEYLGDEWFELINACADEAEKTGLEAWLYDEDRWPSGLAGGMVTQHPEFRQKAILLEIDPAESRDNVIYETTGDLDGVICTNLGAGKNRIRFSIIEQGHSGFYNGFTYVDTMNRAATEAFLKCTHEKYAQKCGGRLGKSIKGIFTDEPHRGAVMDGFSMYVENGEYTTPYTPELFTEFKKRFGYDLQEKLPELFFHVNGERVSQVKWHYIELLQQLFIENFAKPCQEWCRKHHLILTGHVLHEDNLTAQTAMCGSIMRYYEHMDYPGVDVLTEGNRNYWIVKQLTSAARQTGKTHLLSELYGCTGWQMPSAGHKAVGDWQALLGINLRCHHLAWYTMRGEAKRDFPASILHQSPWYKEYKHVEDYFARFSLMMAQGEPVCDLLIVNPVESFWAQIYPGWSKNLVLQDDHLKTLEQSYQMLFTWLLESQVDFDYGDEEMLSRLASIDGDILNVGSAKYKTVLISGMETIRSTTVELLKKFEATGGNVIIAGDTPGYVNALKANIPDFKKVEFLKNAVLSAVPAPAATVDAADIFGQLRRTETGLIFAALNVDRDHRRENATVRIKTELPVFEWNCETGAICAVETVNENGWQTFAVDFPAGGQKLWIASVDATPSSRFSEPAERGAGSASTINGPFDYALSEPNICVLDSAQFRLNNEYLQPEMDVLKIDQQVRDRYGVMRRGGEMLQPWFTAQHPIKELCPVELRFTFEIKTIPEWIDLVIEEPENFAVEINGTALDFAGAQRWIDIAFHRIRIPAPCLKTGTNEITLKTQYTENSNLEAIYLLGNFGVELAGAVRRIIPAPEKLNAGDICLQGFPFYSGGVIYRVPLPENARRLRLPAIAGACAKVNGQILGWDPFEADVSDYTGAVDVEIILTRRNTFGPLHDAVKNREHNGPDHWITEGNDFSPVPILLPAGLLRSPEII
ncbi:MAG: glycosyl hydrolase [Kiritimatiellales bacterium]